jgi:tetratricopeptide (TPR) repeat protein
MKRAALLFFALVCGAHGALLFASGPVTPYLPVWLQTALDDISAEGYAVPGLSNRYLVESIRASNLARIAYADGDYDLSIQCAADAIRAARLSDEWIAKRLKMSAADKKISEARDRLGWADSTKARYYFAAEFNNAKAYYNRALLAKTAGEWDDALYNALYAVHELSAVVAPPHEEPDAGALSASVKLRDTDKLPARYVVRPWDTFGDCFWNIAARPWVYNNPYRWPLLYKANREKLPEPGNPNLLEPGIILDIPPLKGEVREGVWDSGVRYHPLKSR